MKILLDECLPVNFRHSFPGHDAHSVEWAGLKGKKNGELLRDAELAGYEILITVDQGIPHQQHLTGRKLSIIAIRSRTNQLEDLPPLAADILNALALMNPGQIMKRRITSREAPDARMTESRLPLSTHRIGAIVHSARYSGLPGTASKRIADDVPGP
jgi:predicted nuclease of predicted toxin-antitoxin system